MLSNVEKEKLIIDLYYNQRKNVRQIAQEARISFRDWRGFTQRVIYW
jgi:DNA-directed RNA polymerase specialized sigma subunit